VPEDDLRIPLAIAGAWQPQGNPAFRAIFSGTQTTLLSKNTHETTTTPSSPHASQQAVVVVIRTVLDDFDLL
jgi:hypothetical protein